MNAMSGADYIYGRNREKLSRSGSTARSARSSRTHRSRRSFQTHDYSVGVFYGDEHGVSLVARAQSVPVHIFAALTSVETILKTYRGDIHQGDLFLACDPYFGGGHLPNWTVVKPVFVDDEPRFLHVRARSRQ